MNQNSIDRLRGALGAIPSRRDVLRGLSGAGLGLGAMRLPDLADAKKKRKRKKKKKVKKAQPNEFGCFEVGDPCKTAADCCSGICEGKQGKRTCRAHDTGICKQDAPAFCELENQQSAYCDDFDCACFRTTAGSSVCAQTVECAECQKDADCAALGYPPGSACIPFGGAFACEDLCESGMACTIPCGAALPES